MYRIKSKALLTISQIVLWGTLLLCHLLEPSVVAEKNPFSKYGALSSSVLAYVVGLALSSVFILILAKRITVKYNVLKISLIILGVATILTLVFRIDMGSLSFQIHRVLSVTLFVSIIVGVIQISLSYKTTVNLLLAGQIIFGFIMLILSSGEAEVLDLLLMSEIIVLSGYTVWLQYNFRNLKDITKEPV